MNSRNFGLAAEKARAAGESHPTSAPVHLLAAQAEAQLGNAGNSAAAFGRAMEAGLEAPDRELAEPVFDQVRGTAAFEPVRRRLRPVRSAMADPPSAAPGRETLRAGDVEIIEDESGSYVRAGDLVLDTRP